jgi:hypothetical protein
MEDSIHCLLCFQRVEYLDHTDSYASVANKRGTVEFDAPAGTQISVLGLRATTTGAVTTIPVFAK